MKALTLHEPWASALVYGPKDFENRDWRPYPGVLGTWVLISSAKKWDARNARGVLENWREIEPATFPEAFARALRKHWKSSSALRDPRMEFCRYGHVLGAVRFDGVLHRPTPDSTTEVAGFLRNDLIQPLEELARRADAAAAAVPWFMGSEEAPYGWHRADRLPFHRPVPVRGFQKLWSPAEDVLARCRSELEEAAAEKGIAL